MGLGLREEKEDAKAIADRLERLKRNNAVVECQIAVIQEKTDQSRQQLESAKEELKMLESQKRKIYASLQSMRQKRKEEAAQNRLGRLLRHLLVKQALMKSYEEGDEHDDVYLGPGGYALRDLKENLEIALHTLEVKRRMDREDDEE